MAWYPQMAQIFADQEAAGWKIGSTAEFLKLSDAEAMLVKA
ncbi:MAG: hypothetical protein RIK87_30880 [Fuerstiella sp.]